MFTQRKRKNYKPMYILLGILLVFAIAFVFWPDKESKVKEENAVVSNVNNAVSPTD